jgi:hypothetical protein
MNTTTVEIPADVRDNFETVTDYAFSRHLSTHLTPPTFASRDRQIELADLFGYTHYQWFGTTQGTRHGWGAGQRYRVDLLVNRDGEVVYHFLTMYFTRVACAECEYSYASVYQVIATEEEISEAVPRCDFHADVFRRAVAGTPGLVLAESEHLISGQHD